MFFLGLITRCKDEFFIKEFCDYYLTQGIDKIFVIDDDSKDKTIYNDINDIRVEIIYEKNIIQKKYANEFYKKIKNDFMWMIHCDVDEFITTRKILTNSIADELRTTFKDADCVKIPWIMMACNNRQDNPKSILKENVYRWNHDKKHPHPNNKPKFRCRYNEIEVKCIFKTSMFDAIKEHQPIKPLPHANIVDSIRNEPSILSPFYSNLREKDICEAHLICQHYRIISRQNCLHKLNTSILYKPRPYSINDLMATDYSEIIDETLKYKSLRHNTTV